MAEPHPGSQIETPTYGGWQPDRAGFLGSLSLPGAVLVAAGIVLVLIPIYGRSLAGLIVTGPMAVLLAAVAFCRVGGLPADSWLSLAVRHAVSRLTGAHRYAAPATLDRIDGPAAEICADRPTSSQPAQPRDHDPTAATEMGLPGALAGLRVLAAPTGTGHTAAVLHDPAGNTWALVARLSHPGLALAGAAEQTRRVDGWGALLAGLCRQDAPIVRLAVTQRSAPDDGTSLSGWLANHADPDAPTIALDNLRQLTAQAGPAATARDCWLTVVMSAARARAAIRGAGGGSPGAAAVLIREWQALQPALTSAGLTVSAPLDPRALGAVIRTGYDPTAGTMLAIRQAAAPGDPGWTGLPAGVDPAAAGPAGAINDWAAYRHDSATTVTFAVAGWPRTAVYPACLQPLSRARPAARRSFTLLVEPLGPRRAARELSGQRTVGLTRLAWRTRTGRTESEDDRLAYATAAAQDRARASGHGISRFTALLAVTVTHPADLDTAVAELVQDAAAARLELRRLYGAQDVGFAAACLPLGTGLPARTLTL